MPKTIRGVFSSSLTFEKLMEAHWRAKLNKPYKREILMFQIDLESNISNIYTNIKNKTYRVGKYKEFIIKIPKERLIKSLPYADRIIHQWYVEEFIKPFIVPRFINDSYACITNRGTHNAADKIQKYMRIMKRKYGKYYIVKCDIKKYFYSIDKEILYKIMKRYISDKDLLFLTYNLIFDEEGEEKGIPIGNYTSQYFANIYLNELDYYIKENLKVKFYVRYMDDFVILLPTKQEAKYIFEKINCFLKENLELELNSKSRYYASEMGTDFCGYRIFETHRLLRVRSKKRMKMQIKNWHKKAAKGSMNEKKVTSKWKSWIAHSSHANSYNLKKKMYEKFRVCYIKQEKFEKSKLNKMY